MIFDYNKIAMSKKPKTRKGAWFVKTRGSFLPSSWQGWLLYIPFIGYLIFSEAAGLYYTNNNPVETTLIVVPNWIAAVIVMTWLAKRTS